MEDCKSFKLKSIILKLNKFLTKYYNKIKLIKTITYLML